MQVYVAPETALVTGVHGVHTSVSPSPSKKKPSAQPEIWLSVSECTQPSSHSAAVVPAVPHVTAVHVHVSSAVLSLSQSVSASHADSVVWTPFSYTLLTLPTTCPV